MPVPAIRITPLNTGFVNPAGSFILYWMTANRRLHYNFALQRAVEWAGELQKPILIFEALKCDYRWASTRLHRFVIQGMLNNQTDASKAGVSYLSYVEPHAGHGLGLLQTLANDAAVVVTDDFPCFFLPAMTRAAARRTSTKFEAVDSNGLLPMRSADTTFSTAYAFRRYLQKTLAPFLSELPLKDPLALRTFPRQPCVPQSVLSRWQIDEVGTEQADVSFLKTLPIDASVGPAVFDGGSRTARTLMKEFLSTRLPRYASDRSQPDEDPSSGLSPYLHFGHISSHEIFAELTKQEGWSENNLGDVRVVKGSRSGWWGMSESAESFLDELITWRELGYNMCCRNPDYDQYESLPDFALQTLAKHSSDVRPHLYSAEELRDGKTHDQLWNAAQNQLVTEGRMHNYLRMLWGKKILEWSESPQQALSTMIELNNRYAVDGRNPNSYSGIFWVLGRYDRAWGPERPIFGKIRYMSSDNTRRKLKLTGYLEKYAPEATV